MLRFYVQITDYNEMRIIDSNLLKVNSIQKRNDKLEYYNPKIYCSQTKKTGYV